MMWLWPIHQDHDHDDQRQEQPHSTRRVTLKKRRGGAPVLYFGVDEPEVSHVSAIFCTLLTWK
jgi:hypothetical protein